MSYVLERDFANTNFMQNKMIASNTNAIALHSDQLVKAGQDLTYFGEKVTELNKRSKRRTRHNTNKNFKHRFGHGFW